MYTLYICMQDQVCAMLFCESHTLDPSFEVTIVLFIYFFWGVWVFGALVAGCNHGVFFVPWLCRLFLPRFRASGSAEAAVGGPEPEHDRFAYSSRGALDVEDFRAGGLYQ